MATLQDLGVSAFINILSAFVFLLLFAVLRIQPVNDRVYFPKLYLAHKRQHDHTARSAVRRFVNLNICTYITFLSWVPGALRMSETELVAHAGLDSAVYLRIYTLGYYPIRRRNSLFLFARPSAASSFFFFYYYYGDFFSLRNQLLLLLRLQFWLVLLLLLVHSAGTLPWLKFIQAAIFFSSCLFAYMCSCVLLTAIISLSSFGVPLNKCIIFTFNGSTKPPTARG
jgi:hypothetical protein